MMRNDLALLAIALCALFLGGISAKLSLGQKQGFGALQIGSWFARPFNSGKKHNPYTRARLVRTIQLPLGAQEGIEFFAQTDQNDERLDLECNYVLSGTTPPGSFWTLTGYLENDENSATDNKTKLISASLISDAIIRFDDGSFVITAGPQIRSGNWMQLTGKGHFRLVMRLYDVQSLGSGALEDPQMPSIQRQKCFK